MYNQNPMVRPDANMNSMIRQAGSRLRTVQQPNIGQYDAPPPPSGQPSPPPQAAAPAAAPMPQPQPMQRKPPAPFTIHPPGVPSDPQRYTYTPTPQGAWMMYPPGVQAPPEVYHATMPRAASTNDLIRMKEELGRFMKSPPQSQRPPAQTPTAPYNNMAAPRPASPIPAQGY